VSVRRLPTGERIHAGDVVSTTGERLISGTRDWWVASRERPARLMPELTIVCYENFPLHGGREVVVTGTTAVIPQRFGGRGGGSGGRGGRGGDSGDPTAPLGSGGCVAALVGTNGPDTLTGADTLAGGPGLNAYDAGPGSDFVDARNGRRELVRCGSGRDRARLDRRDRARSCERVSRPG
jgi:hypothetical protein